MKLPVILVSLLLVVLCPIGSIAENSHLLQSTINSRTLRQYFPNANIKQASRVNCTMLKPDLRPTSWTDRIPFGVGIDAQTNTAYYLLYESFFSKRIMPIPNMNFKGLSDIAAHPNGLIAVADGQGNQIQFFQFKYPTLTSVAFVKVKQPRRVEFDPVGRVWSISDDGVTVYSPGVDQLNALPNETLKINDALAGQKLIDLTVNRKGRVLVLTDESLVMFTSSGDVQASRNLQARYAAMDVAAYGEVYLLREKEKKIDVFGNDLTEFLTIDLSSDFTQQPVDLTIYDNFGYVIVAAPKEGAYYGIGMEILTPKIVPIEDGRGHRIQFTLSMPGYVSVTVQGRTVDQRRELAEKVLLPSGTQGLFWDGEIDGARTDHAKITIRATGAYSLTNTARSEIGF